MGPSWSPLPSYSGEIIWWSPLPPNDYIIFEWHLILTETKIKIGGIVKKLYRLQWMQYYKFTFVFIFIVTEIIESELLWLLLRWPYGQSTIGSQYDKTTYISQSTQISWLGLSGRGGGWWWVKGVEKAWNFFSSTSYNNFFMNWVCLIFFNFNLISIF